MREIHQEFLAGERTLFRATDLEIYDTIFDNGESPLKHSKNIKLHGCMFKWKYPLWYGENITLDGCSIFEMGRAGIWYTNNITVTDTIIEAPKNFRRCIGVKLEKINFSNAAETLWDCGNVMLGDVTAKGDYFAMRSSDMEVDGLKLVGNYSFDGGKNIIVRNSTLLSKDAFWNCENVTVYDSFISGEYLAWNSKNVTFIDCTIESLQGLCFTENLVMKNCKLINTTLAFEYSTVNADIIGHINSVKNPCGGVIRAKSIGELILEENEVDISKTKIIFENNC
ncbi:MAG: DUF3737 family protein [Bacteroides sp.]|nr:DUF3737 family protein [Eubacterium sp.]MCM1418195.1 DUF3737 family protein [Roseburia sp.]MCM1462744.1 DUF3737 family protein [Bacteroides sp.]